MKTRQRFFCVLLASALTMLLPGLSPASVNSDLTDFYSSLGYEGNSTQGHAYEGQEAGYYSGGGLFLRNQVRNLQLVQVTLPSFSAGCGGIDLFLGGFSFINTDQITQFVQQIMSSATGYMFDLALETAVPELKSVKDFIEKTVDDINSMNINSCEAAQDLVGGLWPKTQGSQQEICKDMASQSNAASDWASARQDCGTGGQFNSDMAKAENDPTHKAEVIVNKNLIWDSLSNSPFLTGETEMKEMLMSLTGSLIFDDQGHMRYLPGLSDNESLIKALLYGGKAMLYRCNDTEKCLNPSAPDPSTATLITAQSALVNQVALTIQSLITSAENDTPITDKQKGFINSTPLSILKFITVFLAAGREGQAEQLTQYSEIIAEGILAQYLSENVEMVETSLKTNDFPEEITEKLEQHVLDAKKQIEKMRQHAGNSLADALSLERSMQYVERQVSTDLAQSLANKPPVQ